MLSRQKVKKDDIVSTLLLVQPIVDFPFYGTFLGMFDNRKFGKVTLAERNGHGRFSE